MKTKYTLVLIVAFLAPYIFAFPFAPAAGQPGSTAIHMDSSDFVAWADGYTNVQYGTHVGAGWKTPAKALGPAVGGSSDIVCLGRGGQVTMIFSQRIADGSGYDFAVFENGVSDTFLELGWVEVSSDGVHFTRFPNYSYTADPVGGFGSVDPAYLYGLASKYKQGYGTPFDLDELQTAYESITNGTHNFANTYAEAFTNNYPYLDFSDVSYVRIVDIVGNGSAFDAEGFVVYDPYPTSGSAGFDLDAVGVINQPAPDGLPQAITFDPIPHQKLAFGLVELNASANSGLPVALTIQSGSASISNNVLVFASTGTVEVVANQAGNATYAPAPPMLRSFQVAEEIQHIFVEPIPNQVAGDYSVQVHAYASSGLPVQMEVYSGPLGASINPTNHLLSITNEVGEVVLRAFQPGNATTAPAKDVFIDFEIVGPGASNAPIVFASWLASNAVPEVAIGAGTDVYGRSAMVLDFTLDRRASAYSRIIQSADLDSWTNAVPEIVEIQYDPDFIHFTVQFPADAQQHYYRLIFEGL